MMQGDNGNIKEVLGIASLINYLVIYLVYHCIIVFCLYNETTLYNNIMSSMADYNGYSLKDQNISQIYQKHI